MDIAVILALGGFDARQLGNDINSPETIKATKLLPPLLHQGRAARCAIWVKVWPLPYANSPIPKAIAVVIECSAVERTAVGPDGWLVIRGQHGEPPARRVTIKNGLQARTNIIRGLPLVPNLKIVVLVLKVQEPGEKLAAPLLGQAVDVLDMAAYRKHTLPSRHGLVRTTGRIASSSLPTLSGLSRCWL